MTKIFYSHTQKDKKFLNEFDTNVCARVGIEAFRSELEEISLPAWETIALQISQSVALFVLIGEELVKFQESNAPDWKFTQNWISYEIGIACQLGIDVWAVCDDVPINFPMPYVNNYCPVGISQKDAFKYFRNVVFQRYKERHNFPFPFGDISTGNNLGVICPHKNCEIEFNLHMILEPGETITCPQCLEEIIFPEGFNLPPTPKKK